MNKVETPDFSNKSFNNFISGFVAGEGCFTYSNLKDSGRKRFTFQISLSDVDKDIVKKIEDYLGVGSVYCYEARNENYKPEVNYQVQAIGEIGSVIIPFFDKVGLYNTHKQKQYDEWRETFIIHYDLTERFD